MNLRNFFWLVTSLLWGFISAGASPNNFTYQGRIVKNDGSPLEYSAVAFEFRITNPSGSCVIFREQINGVDMTNSRGMFDTPIGAGTKLFPTNPSFSLLDAFDNSLAQNCEGGATYTPLSTDGRLLRVQFHDGVGWKSITPDNVIRSVPFSAYASKAASAETLGTKSLADLVLKAAIPLCTGGYVLTSTAVGQLSCTPDLGGSSGTVNSIAGSPPVVVSNGGAGAYTISVNVGTTAGTVAEGNDSRITNAMQSGQAAGGDLSGSYPAPTVSKIAGIAVATTSLSSGQVFKFNGSSWTNASLSTSDISGMSAYMTLTAFTNAVSPAASCASSQSMYWNSVTSAFACQNISLPTSVTDNFWNGNGTNIYRSSGNVGIGTTTPESTLTILSTTPSTATHPNRAGLIVKAEGSDVGGRVVLRTASSSENPTVSGFRSQGTLLSPAAINTSQHLLSLVGMGYDGASWKEGGSILFSPGENWDSSKAGANIIFKTVTNGSNISTEKMRLAHNGRVGLGTSSPTAALDIDASASGTTTSARFAANPGATGAGNFNAIILDNTFGAGNFKNEIKFRSAGSERWSLGSDPAGIGEQTFYIWDAVANARRMSIDSNGNIGIGLDSPTQKIDVAGKIKATEFCIGNSCVSTWPAAGGSSTDIQLGNVSSVPVATDCDDPAEYGKITSDATNEKIYLCTASGWITYTTGGPTVCPTGYTLIGNAGLPSSYCISTVEKTAASFLAAKTACFAENSTRGSASLCTNDQWYRACKSGVATNMTGNNEWASSEHYNVGGTHYAVTMGQSTCDTMTDSTVTSSKTYRCCIK